MRITRLLGSTGSSRKYSICIRPVSGLRQHSRAPEKCLYIFLFRSPCKYPQRSMLENSLRGYLCRKIDIVSSSARISSTVLPSPLYNPAYLLLNNQIVKEHRIPIAKLLIKHICNLLHLWMCRLAASQSKEMTPFSKIHCHNNFCLK